MSEVALVSMSIILNLVNHESTSIMFKQVAYRIVLPIVHTTYVILSTFVKMLCFVCVCVCVYQYAAHFTELALLALRTLYISYDVINARSTCIL
jgi:hypothetical protein